MTSEVIVVEYFLRVVKMDLPNDLWDFAEAGSSIRTSLVVDVVRDFSFLTRICQGDALKLSVPVVVMKYLFVEVVL
jgi:hypothetical protein